MDQKEEIKDLDKVEPIDYGVIAKPHTPVYKMHRYFARRPYTVFNELIRHYSNPGSIVLDPMCGGGVTIIEGLRLKRKVIGVDLDPMATFITKMEAINVDLDELKQTFYELRQKIKDEIESLYFTKCPKCGKEVPANWFEWSNVYRCGECGASVALAKVKKLRWGTYQCINYPKCESSISITSAEKLKEIPILIQLSCPFCKTTFQKEPDNSDIRRADYLGEHFDELVNQKKLWYPQDIMPQEYELRRPYNRMFYRFTDFIQRRNLLSLAMLFKGIESLATNAVKEVLEGTFCSTLNWACRMCVLKKGSPAGWASANYWTQNVFLEINVWNSFSNRFKATLKGKEYSKSYLENYPKESKTFKELQDDKNVLLLNKSATALGDIPSNSVDVIITDPPYGGNVMYSELSNFYAIWIKDALGMQSDALIDDTEEAIVSKPHSKSLKDYRNLMRRIFEECYRVLKPNRWMVMTFHNREFKVWSAIHLAAHDAGFVWSEKDGMIYQPPIQQYITTIYQYRPGSMLGDFILSYKKAETPPEEKWIEEAEIGNKIREIAKQAIEYHGGAKLSTIYTRLMPFLLNSGLLEQMTDRDLEPYLRKYFVKKDDKWYLPEAKAEEIAEAKPEYYAPVKARVESIIRRFLYGKHRATVDEILNTVYSRLINSNAAEYEEIVHVLNRICIKVAGDGGKAVYQLKEERDRELLFKFTKEKAEEYRYSEESDHDAIIEQLARIGKQKGYESHIGLAEQNKDKNFRELSIPMGSNVQFGLDQVAFNRIREIDLLWIKGISIMAAFEVEVSTSIDSGITRFRELFAATPALSIPVYIIIPDKREKEARGKIGSLANRREGITERIKYIVFSDILGKEDVNIAKVTKGVC